MAFLGLIAVIAAVERAAARGSARAAVAARPDRPPRRFHPVAAPLPIDLVRISRRLAASEASAADARRHLGAARRRDRGRSAAPRRTPRSIPTSVYAHLPRPVPAALALVLDPALDELDTRQLPGLDPDARNESLVRALEQL